LEDAKMVDPCIVGELVSHTHQSLVYLGGWLTGTQALHHKHPVETFINIEFTYIDSITSNYDIESMPIKRRVAISKIFGFDV